MDNWQCPIENLDEDIREVVRLLYENNMKPYIPQSACFENIYSNTQNDLYYRYNRVVNEKKVNSRACTGNINPSIAIERRIALEWILSVIDDWYNISLDA